MVFVLSIAVTVVMSVAVPVPVTIVRMGLDGMGNQVEKSITKQSTGGESEQCLQSRLHFFRVVQRDGEQDEKRSGADQQRRAKRMDPNVEGIFRSLTVNGWFFLMMMMVMMTVVAMIMMMMSMIMIMIVVMMMMMMWISHRFFEHLIRMFRVLEAGIFVMMVMVVLV